MDKLSKGFLFLRPCAFFLVAPQHAQCLASASLHEPDGIPGSMPHKHGWFRGNDTLRFVFKMVLERCLTECLVGSEGLAMDASAIKPSAWRT